MAFDWRRWANTVIVTFILTSAFWVAFGIWFYQHDGGAGGQSRQSAVRQARAGGSPGLIIPVVGVRPAQLVDTFTQARAGGARVHDAIDIMAPEGTPVVAAASGRVEKLFLSHDGGNTVYVRTPDGGTILYYAHLLDYAPGLKEGEQIEQGAPIGRVGHTGNADAAAPHLHFAVTRTTPDKPWSDEGVALNPYPMLAGKPGQQVMTR